MRKIPTGALKDRLGINGMDRFAPLEELPLLVRRVRIALKQHVGLPARPLVRPGDRVGRGQPIAEPPPGKLGATLHASIDGTVRSVEREFIDIVK